MSAPVECALDETGALNAESRAEFLDAAIRILESQRDARVLPVASIEINNLGGEQWFGDGPRSWQSGLTEITIKFRCTS